MKAFHNRRFEEAHDLFQQVQRGPAVDLLHAAATHALMCERRMKQEAPKPRSPEDSYTLAVALITRGESLDEAEALLRSAIRQQEDASHFHYAMALCLGLRGDGDSAARHLRRSIDLSPDNRTAARNDPDFQSLARIPQIREALG
ncbi:MAG: hypothetical protein R2729_14570 [Bryobacteraceae bacterium]